MTESHKAGCRRKGCIIPAVSITPLIAFFVGREVYLALTATPGSAVDYHALAEELVASHQPTEGENGWDLLLQAIDRMQAFEEQNEGSDYYGNGYLHLLRPADWNEQEYGVSREELTAAGMAGLAGLREAGVWDLLDQLAGSPRVVRPLPRVGILLDVLLPELGQTRSLARALLARMRVSHDAGDDADVAAAFVQGCGLARALMHQFTLIDQLVGIAIFMLIDGELRYALVERPLDEQSLAMIADALDQMSSLPPELPFQGERLFMLDTIQWMYTDDGHGNGRLNLSQTAGIQRTVNGERARSSSWVNLGSIAFPSKKQTTRLAEEFYSAVIKAARTPRNERDALKFDPDTWLDQLSKRHILIHIMVPAVGKAIETRDLFDTLLAGTRTMVAIERFNLRDGLYPATLDQLVPDFLTALPVDPFARDGRFIYRTLDPAADEFGRSYTLYSVGIDQTDDGGLHDRTLDIKVFREGESGTDYVFNLPRPDAGD